MQSFWADCVKLWSQIITLT